MPMGDAPGVGKYRAEAIQIGPRDVGSRVTIRRVVPGGFSDTVGELMSTNTDITEVRRRDGEVVRLVTDQIVAARVVR